MRRTLIMPAGLLVLGISIFGIFHGSRASVAQKIYHEAKYGKSSSNLTAVLALSERSRQLYPQNYYLNILAGEGAYYADPGNNVERKELLAKSEEWCDAGLLINYYRSELRYLKVRHLERKSLPEAVRCLEDYVDWNYWVPFNHYELVKLYVRSGDLDKAAAACRLLTGREYCSEAGALLRKAWTHEKFSAPVSGTPQKPRKQ